MQTTEQIVLTGSHVRLEPLNHGHSADLAEAVADGDIFRRWYTYVPRPEAMLAEVESRLERKSAGVMMPFAVVDVASGRAVGMTAYAAVDPVVPRVEIGYTWLGRSAQGTATNPEAKFLMLQHAFEVWHCECVGFRTQSANHQSQAALAKLGARREGVLRAGTRRDGVLVDVVLFSILRHEWPEVRRGLEERLATFA